MSDHYDRRAFMSYFSSIGLGSTLLPGVLWAKVSAGDDLTAATVACAEEIAGLSFDDAEREMMVENLKTQEKALETLHAIPLPNAIAPSLVFDPLLPGMALPTTVQRKIVRSKITVGDVPADLEALAFRPVTELSELVRRKKVTSLQLTQMYLGRLKEHGPALQCVVTLTEERALAQARAMDAEIAGGKWRGPLHGIPWGAKDLFAVKGYPTSWGTTPYKDQMFDEDAAVVRRLDAAGAVLVAKLTLGELAMGDVWFGGTTKNPWKLDEGSSGSSAGSAAATAAGLVAFALGTETLGSISSPATRCGVTGLRPTFGRVPRTGAMALSWSMDKVGSLCRTVEDCALVFDAIRGRDGHDAAVRDAAFNYDAGLDVRTLRIGYVKASFDQEGEQQHPWKAFDDAALEALRVMGVNLIPVALPDLQYGAMRLMLSAEAAAAFDELTRSGKDAQMTRQDRFAWPNSFRTSRFIPAVDYVNASRARTLAMRAWAELMSTVDVIVTPTFGTQLVATNLTGHPALILPNGFRENGTPVSLTFLAGLYDEARLLAVAKAYQDATGWHLRHPRLKA